MKQFPAIIAALPREIKPLVRGWDVSQPARNVFVYTNGSAVVACAGMGADRVALAVQAAMRAGPVSTLLSVGVAGSCDAVFPVGAVIRAGVVVDSLTGERFKSSERLEVLVSTPAIASVLEKARLFQAYGASAVDMEAAAVARLARAHGLEFRAVKAISDAVDFELTGLDQFATADGQFREAAFALHASVRPQLWGKLISLARNSGVAISALTAALEEELQGFREKS